MSVRDFLGKAANVAGTAAGTVAKAYVDDAKHMVNEVEKYEEVYNEKSDEYLKKELKRTSNRYKKIAIIHILKSRGY